MGIQVVAHTSFCGKTGYNAHSQAFFTNLNKHIPVRIRNYSYTDDLSSLTEEQHKMLIEQKWNDPPFKIGRPYIQHAYDTTVNIVLNESHHYFFYDQYKSPKIAYNVWESTKQLPIFFKRILQYDQFWCPTKWQRQCTIDQGYPEDRVKVVPEGVDGNIFKPSYDLEIKKNLFKKYNIPHDAFTFMIFGRWDYRKATTEMIRAWYNTFGRRDNCYLIVSVDNQFASDEMKTTEERLKHYKLEHERIKVLHFPPRDEYIKWLQHGSCLLSCSRSEGWNLPLMESLACGTPSICSNWGGHLEFADGIAYKVTVPKELPPKEVYLLGDDHDLGVWGEPDFDHLQDVMKDVYQNYYDAKTTTLQLSEELRKLYTWQNAAKIGLKYIDELVNKTISIPNEKKNNFAITFAETSDGYPKVIFTSNNSHNSLICRIKDSFGKIIYENTFESVRNNLQYWMSCNTSISNLGGIIFEILDHNNKLIHSCHKSYAKQKVSQDMELYQDQYVNGKVIVKGTRDCENRYNALTKVFKMYNRPFTILDIGANFGYYSIRSATEFNAVSVMVENKYNEAQKLVSLCEVNNVKDKLIVLNTDMTLYKLKELSKCEHFDVVLALNIIHHFNRDDVLEICDIMTKLGDNLIIETPPANDSGACGRDNLPVIIDYFSDKVHEILGEFPRHTSEYNSSMMWFKTPKTELKWPYYDYEKLFNNKNYDVEKLKNRGSNIINSNFDNKEIISPRRESSTSWISGINLKTFIELNGIYPTKDFIVEKLKNKDLITDYKWDNTNNDLIVHNVIMNGHELHLIDFDDKLIVQNELTDEDQLHNIIDVVLNNISVSVEEESSKVKLNLGCGNDIKPGYINIDRYNNTGQVDMKCDIADLPFADNTVDEIFTAHVFEHIMINDVYAVLEEWYRALKLDGKLVMKLPNLENEVRIWLDAPPERKWFEVHRIFGSQSHDGNTHFSGHNPESLKWLIERFGFTVETCNIQNVGFGDEIKLVARKSIKIELAQTNYISHFVDGPFLQIQGDSKDKSFYIADFLDPDNNASVHQQTLSVNSWTRPHRKYFTNWLVRVNRNGKLVFEHKYDAEGKNILISFDTKSLGDSIAWVPKVEEFRLKHKCNLYLSTFWNNLFEKAYPDIKFVIPGSRVENLYASYLIGCWEGNLHKNKVDWRTVPLQHVCSNILGLEHKEIICDLGIKLGDRPIKEKYVTMSEFSTFQCKFWNHPSGWKEVVNYLNDLGYKVVSISKEETKLENIIKMNNRPIEETITNIAHSEFFIGISSGPSWLAWALRKPTVLISGYSSKWAEFESNIERVINENVCHGCFNKTNNNFERGNWMWCPFQKGTPRQFECSKTITPQMVISAIQNITTKGL